METQNRVGINPQETAGAIKIKVGLLYKYSEGDFIEHTNNRGWEFEIPKSQKASWKRVYASGDKLSIYYWLMETSEFVEWLYGRVFNGFSNIHEMEVFIASVDDINFKYWHTYETLTSEEIKEVAVDFDWDETEAVEALQESHSERGIELARLRPSFNEYQSTSHEVSIEQDCKCGGKIIKNIYFSAGFREWEPLQTTAPGTDPKPFAIRQFIPVRCNVDGCGAENEIVFRVEIN